MSTMTLQLPNSFVDVERDEMEYVDGGGFVGLHVHISDFVLNLGAGAGTAFVVGYVGWYVKPLATTGPWGAGAAGAIIAVAGGVTAWAIKCGLKDFYIGRDISFASWTKDVYIGY